MGVRNVKPLIFVQDTILLPRIVRERASYANRECKRRDLENELYSELYKSNQDAANELGVSSPNGYKSIVRFVPGVISYVDGPNIFTWRREHVYDLLKGIIALHLYEELKKVKGSRVAIVLDTTHGINYFAVALKEATLVASELYALSRGISSLEELTIYHYNSDPVSKAEGTAREPSLKLHLLGRIPIVRSHKLSFPYTSLLLESTTSIDGMRGLKGKLKNFWAKTRWDKVLEALLLFSRGLLAWALKISVDTANEVPSEQDLLSAAKNIKVKFKEKRKPGRIVFNINYDWDTEAPAIHVTSFSILFNILRSYAIKALASNTVTEEAWRKIQEIRDQLRQEENRAPELEKIASELTEIISKEHEFKCFNINAIMDIVKKVYALPQCEINTHEIENNIKRYLQGEEPKWRNPLYNHQLRIYREPQSKAHFIIHQNTRLLLPLTGVANPGPRVIYAHAGLAYGLRWFSNQRK